MKFLKFLVDKRSRDSADHAANAATGVLPPVNLTSPTRPIKSAGNGEKKPKVGKLTFSANCLEYVKRNAERGNPASVINCIDEFASTNHMMNIGQVKGAVIDEEIRKKKPTVMAELGAYTGYSAVRFASLQREVAGNESHYYSFEYSPVFAARVREMVEIAGLTNQVTVYVGEFSEQYGVLRGKTVDLYFIDHEKTVYLSDLKLIISSETLAPGSIIAADNVVRPGAPDYLEFIENSPQFSTVRHTIKCGRDGKLLPDLSIATFLG
ncbi:catechol O-methyltransferase 2 [Phytophthora nicotianae]|uniref:catechol O-methyltransferase n=1 Tax=Phytophthora nicotianae TaxID=4792 RepID=A0A0W8BZW4_PHYNI|nr:catechol O-methyltransferase 2 [Phytophthora nicotianae]